MRLQRRAAQLDMAFRSYTPYRLLPRLGPREARPSRAGTKGATAMIALAYMAYLIYRGLR